MTLPFPLLLPPPLKTWEKSDVMEKEMRQGEQRVTQLAEGRKERCQGSGERRAWSLRTGWRAGCRPLK